MSDYTSLVQFGDFYRLDTYQEIDLTGLEDKWSQYNPDKPHIPREGMCVVNDTGYTYPGPALGSLLNTSLNESDFNKPTEIAHLFNVQPWWIRTHLIKLKPGGYFPPHRDHSNPGKQNTFRLIVPIKNCRPPSVRFMLEDKTLDFRSGYEYFVNTTKEHCLFNMSNKDSIWLVINAKICEESIKYVCDNLAIR